MIQRSGSPITLTATPARNGKIGRLGVGIGDDTKSVKPGFFEACTLSVQKNVQMAEMIGQTVWGLITRQVSRNQLMGPIAIAQLSPVWRASAMRPPSRRQVMRIRSPQSGFTSSNTASGAATSPRNRGWRNRSRMTGP